ncbi:MAG TPA: hypothetical protein VFZ56_01690, partial [Gemmatimonadaceae bacterium]
MNQMEATMGMARVPGMARRPGLSVLAWLWPVALIAAQVYAFAISPPDRDMGDLQKIMYVHVPAAWNAFLAFFIVFSASLLYLWKRNEKYDLLA